MNTVQQNRVLSLQEFKGEIKAKQLDIKTSDRTGKKYAFNGDTIVANVSKDIDLAKPINVLDMVDTDSGEQWFFIKNETNYTSVGSI